MHRSPTGRRPPTPFVGRQHELAVLQELVAQVAAGQGYVVGIVGEPGMGKSRLVYELRQRLGEDHVTYLAGQCVSHGTAMPYRPVLELLRDLCGITALDNPTSRRTKVHHCLQKMGLDPAEEAPYLIGLLAGPDHLAALQGMSSEAVRSRTFATLHRLYRHRSQPRPLLLGAQEMDMVQTHFHLLNGDVILLGNIGSGLSLSGVNRVS